MLFVLVLVAVGYLVSFLWFCSLCRKALQDHRVGLQKVPPSNLIPFERGLKLRVHKTFRAV